jgi:hypothetical protein
MLEGRVEVSSLCALYHQPDILHAKVGLCRAIWRLIRFGGHLPKGEYDVQTDGRHAKTPAAPAIR